MGAPGRFTSIAVAAGVLVASALGFAAWRSWGKPVDHAMRGYDALVDGRTQDAIAELKQASAEHPDDAKVHFDLGIAYERAGWSEQAVAEFERAHALDPKSEKFRRGLADTRRTFGYRAEVEGRHDDAVKLYLGAVELAPDDALTWYNLSVSFTRANKPAEAADARRRAAEIDPKYAAKSGP